MSHHLGVFILIFLLAPAAKAQRIELGGLLGFTSGEATEPTTFYYGIERSYEITSWTSPFIALSGRLHYESSLAVGLNVAYSFNTETQRFTPFPGFAHVKRISLLITEAAALYEFRRPRWSFGLGGVGGLTGALVTDTIEREGVESSKEEKTLWAFTLGPTAEASWSFAPKVRGMVGLAYRFLLPRYDVIRALTDPEEPGGAELFVADVEMRGIQPYVGILFQL